MARASVKRETPVPPPISEVTLVLNLEEAIHLYRLIGGARANDLNWCLFNIFKLEIFDGKHPDELDFPEQS